MKFVYAVPIELGRKRFPSVMTASRVSACEALSGDTTTRATVADKVHSTTQDNVTILRMHSRGPEEAEVNIRL